MKDQPANKNGIHPITKLAVEPAPEKRATVKVDPPDPNSPASKLYGKKVGLRGKPKE